MDLLSTLFIAALLSTSYVLSLYIWRNDNQLDRDHPETIKRRFMSAFCMLFISAPFPFFFGSSEVFQRAGHSFTSVIGLHTTRLIPAIVCPLILTMSLFLGPLVMFALCDPRRKLLTFKGYWQQSLMDLIWWRNHIVAPLTEEYTYRACMLPVLLNYFSPKSAIFVSPLFFGIAHLHHMYERIRKGQDPTSALVVSLFQMSYTTVFGIYSSFLFLRSGHLAAPVVAHGFCNFMGFPDIMELWNQKPLTRNILFVIYCFGVALFFYLLYPLTNPTYFLNDVYVWPE